MSGKETKKKAEKKEKDLSDKEKLFVFHYLRTARKGESAYLAGYTEKSRKYMAWSLMRRPHIIEAIEKAKQDISFTSGITKLGVLMELKGIAFNDKDKVKKTPDHIRIKAFELINRMLGFFEDEEKGKVAILGSGLTVVTESKETSEELKQLKKELGFSED